MFQDRLREQSTHLEILHERARDLEVQLESSQKVKTSLALLIISNLVITSIFCSDIFMKKAFLYRNKLIGIVMTNIINETASCLVSFQSVASSAISRNLKLKCCYF